MKGFYGWSKDSPVRSGSLGVCKTVMGALAGPNTDSITKKLTLFASRLIELRATSCGVYLYDRGRSA